MNALKFRKNQQVRYIGPVKDFREEKMVVVDPEWEYHAEYGITYVKVKRVEKNLFICFRDDYLSAVTEDGQLAFLTIPEVLAEMALLHTEFSFGGERIDIRHIHVYPGAYKVFYWRLDSDEPYEENHRWFKVEHTETGITKL